MPSRHRWWSVVLALCVGSTSFAQVLADTDNDGLPDEWERVGHGPLSPLVHDVRVGRPDFILIAVRRPGLSASVAEAQLAELRAFFANVPTRNPDGSTGINMIVVPGPVLPNSMATTPYTDPALYAAAMPVAWRGLAHGYLMEADAGGGGQTSSPEWSASGNQWQAMAHELGHQFGLEHVPPGSAGVSPLWPSLMNYTYTYSLGGDPNAVQFSTGFFRSNVLNEGGLSEVVYHPIERLRFLEAEPGFRLQSLGPSVTAVDWNRNGIFGENGVRADVNDGYSTGAVSPSLLGPASAGAPSMVTINDRVYLAYVSRTTDPTTWTTSEIGGSGGRVFLVDFNGTQLSTEPVRLTNRNSETDPHLAAFGSRLSLAYVAARVPFVALWNDTSIGAGLGGELVDLGQRVDQAVLAGGRTSAMPTERLWLVTWAQDTQRVRVVEVIDARTSPTARPVPRLVGSSVELTTADGALMSKHPVAASFDALTGRLVLVTYADNASWGQANKLRVSTFRLVSNTWVPDETRWVGTRWSGWWGTTAPTLVLDQNTPIAGHSQMTIYLRGGTSALDTFEPTYKIREIGDATQNDGWRGTLMVDEWNRTQSPPAAALFNGTHVFALRWAHDTALSNRLVFYRQTGMIPGNLYDWNEVGFLSSTGLRVSLERMRAFHGTP